MNHDAAGLPRRALLTVALAALAALIVATPAHADEHGPIQESYRITTDQAEPQDPFEAFDAETITVFDLDGDGTQEIIAHNDNNDAYVFDGATGEMIGDLETNHPEDWQARELTGISVGDVDGNGVPDLVVANSAGWVTTFQAIPPTDPNEAPQLEKLWEKRMDPREQDPNYLTNHSWAEFEGHPAIDGSAYLADATGDGADEIYLQLDDMPSMYALDGQNGDVRWWNNWSDGNANPIATDFTGDDRIEVMFPSDGGQLMFFDAKEHYPVCTFDVKDHGPTPGSISVAPTVTDIDDDGEKEAIFGVRNVDEDTSDPDWYNQTSAHYFAVNPDCTIVWQKTWDWGNPHFHMRPITADVTGNGQLDVIFQDWNTVGHNPGDWQTTGRANLFAVEGASGDLIWQTQTRASWSNDNLALADVDEDGDEEILLVETRGDQNGLALYSLEGRTEAFHPMPEGWQTTRGPTVTDLTGDGQTEIVLPLHQETTGCERDLDVGCREGMIVVYETQGDGEPTWPNTEYYSHAYDHASEPPRPPSTPASISHPDVPDPLTALDASGPREIRAVHVNVPGTTHWQQLHHQGGDRYQAELAYAPAPGDEVETRILYEDDRVAFPTYNADGFPTLLEITLEDPDGDPVQDAEVTVEQDDETVWSGPATSDGKIRIPVAPGNYHVDAASPDHQDASATVAVTDEGITTDSLEMTPEGLILGLSWVGLLGGTGVLGIALVAGFVAMRKRAWM